MTKIEHSLKFVTEFDETESTDYDIIKIISTKGQVPNVEFLVEWKNKPKVGDKILIPSYEGYRLSKDQTKDGKEYRIILDRNILAIQINEEICQ